MIAILISNLQQVMPSREHNNHPQPTHGALCIGMFVAIGKIRHFANLNRSKEAGR